MWEHMLTVDMLKHNIPDPSTLASGHPQGSISVQDKDTNNNLGAPSNEHLAALVFIHTKLRDLELSRSKIMMLRKALLKYFSFSSFSMNKPMKSKEELKNSSLSIKSGAGESGLVGPDLILLPLKLQDDSQKSQQESYSCMIGKLCDQILSMEPRSFAKPVTEREWLRNTAKIWGVVKKSTVIAEYCNALQDSRLFRK